MAEISTSHVARLSVDEAHQLLDTLKQFKAADKDKTGYSVQETDAARTYLMSSFYTSTNYNVGKKPAHLRGPKVHRTLFANKDAITKDVLKTLESKLTSFISHANSALTGTLECKVPHKMIADGPMNAKMYIPANVPKIMELKLTVKETRNDTASIRIGKNRFEKSCPETHEDFLDYQKRVQEANKSIAE